MPISSIDAPMLLIRVASLTPMMLSTAATSVAPIDNAWIWCVVGCSQISGAKTVPTAAAVPAVPARKETSAIQPVNQPKCGPTRRLDHW